MMRLCHDVTRSATLDEVWSHIFLPDDHGLPRLNLLPLWQSPGQPGRALDVAGRAPDEASNATEQPRIAPDFGLAPDRPGNFKPFKIAGNTSRMLPDVPGPSRTVPAA